EDEGGVRVSVIAVSEDPQGCALLYKRHISAHMCTIENRDDLCKRPLEALSVVMIPTKKFCGRGERAITSAGKRGGTPKKCTRCTPVGLESGAAPSAPTRHPV